MDYWSEYRFRSAFPVTHEQYLDEPGFTVDWLLAVDETRREVEAAKRKREENGR